MPTADDPFTGLLITTWAMLEANAGFRNLVKVSNRIKFEKDDPIKAEVSTLDKPEVRIIPVSLDPTDSPQISQSASNLSMMTFSMQIQIATGMQRLDDASIAGRENVLRVTWETLRAIWAWPTHYTSLTWGTAETAFAVHRVIARAASIGVLIEDLDRGIAGWSSIIELEVAANFGITAHDAV